LFDITTFICPKNVNGAPSFSGTFLERLLSQLPLLVLIITLLSLMFPMLLLQLLLTMPFAHNCFC